MQNFNLKVYAKFFLSIFIVSIFLVSLANFGFAQDNSSGEVTLKSWDFEVNNKTITADGKSYFASSDSPYKSSFYRGFRLSSDSLLGWSLDSYSCLPIWNGIYFTTSRVPGKLLYFNGTRNCKELEDLFKKREELNLSIFEELGDISLGNKYKMTHRNRTYAIDYYSFISEASLEFYYISEEDTKKEQAEKLKNKKPAPDGSESTKSTDVISEEDAFISGADFCKDRSDGFVAWYDHTGDLECPAGFSGMNSTTDNPNGQIYTLNNNWQYMLAPGKDVPDTQYYFKKKDGTIISNYARTRGKKDIGGNYFTDNIPDTKGKALAYCFTNNTIEEYQLCRGRFLVFNEVYSKFILCYPSKNCRDGEVIPPSEPPVECPECSACDPPQECTEECVCKDTQRDQEGRAPEQMSAEQTSCSVDSDCSNGEACIDGSCKECGIWCWILKIIQKDSNPTSN